LNNNPTVLGLTGARRPISSTMKNKVLNIPQPVVNIYDRLPSWISAASITPMYSVNAAARPVILLNLNNSFEYTSSFAFRGTFLNEMCKIAASKK